MPRLECFPVDEPTDIPGEIIVVANNNNLSTTVAQNEQLLHAKLHEILPRSSTGNKDQIIHDIIALLLKLQQYTTTLLASTKSAVASNDDDDGGGNDDGNNNIPYFEFICRSLPMDATKVILPYIQEFLTALENYDDGGHEIWRFVDFANSKNKDGRYFSLLDYTPFRQALFKRNICTVYLDGRSNNFYLHAWELLENNETLRVLVVECGRDISFVGCYKGLHEKNECSVGCQYDDYRRFCRAIQYSSSLEEVHFVDAFFDEDRDENDYHDGYQASLALLLDACVNLNYLKILTRQESGYFGIRGGEHIASFLRSNPNLKSLYLGSEILDISDIRMIAAALKSNCHLRKLALVLDDKGEKAMGDTLFSSYSRRIGCPDLVGLNAVAASNHTCHVQNLWRYARASKPKGSAWNRLLETTNIFEDPRNNRRWKILTVLYATNAKGIDDELKHLPLKLLPLVISQAAQDVCRSDYKEINLDVEGNFDNEKDEKNAPEDEPEESINMMDIETEDNSAMSLEPNSSIQSFDSVMDDLDSAFDERDEVYIDLDQSFLDPTHYSGSRAKATLVYHILKQHGLTLFHKSLS
ncbi:hypothetical protein ACHAWC_008912 [Mediolabrus comicus]